MEFALKRALQASGSLQCLVGLPQIYTTQHMKSTDYVQSFQRNKTDYN